MRNLLAGRTSRSHFWLITFAVALTSFGIANAKDVIGAVACIAIFVAIETFYLIATARRLHDAGWSRWWLLLYFFPMSMTWDLMSVHFGRSAWHFLDITAVIQLIPVIIGLFAPVKLDRGSDTRPLRA